MPRKKKEETTEESKKEDSSQAEEIPKKKTSKEIKESKEVSSQEFEKSEKAVKEEKLAKLKEKAAKLAGEIKVDESDLKKKVKAEIEKQAVGLVPIEDYLKSSIHLGTRAITPDMKPYVYKRRADSLAVFNTALLDEKLKEGAEFLAKYAPNEVIVVCKREAGIKPVEMFSKATGIKAFVKNYPAGILTNPNLDTFLEVELVLICDPWTDKSALEDAKRIKVPVMAVCDTNNYTKDVDKVIPGNNKSAKSLGMILYLLAKIYVEKRSLPSVVPPISEWVESWDTLTPPK